MKASLLAVLLLLLGAGNASARTWTDAKGKFRIEAEFVELKDPKVVLRKPDGRAGPFWWQRISRRRNRRNWWKRGWKH